MAKKKSSVNLPLLDGANADAFLMKVKDTLEN
jgi:hypothetical protein